MKSASILGYLLIVAALLALMRMGAILAAGPVAAGLQVVAVGLMVWARVTFGRRSFHAAANPTEGGLLTTGPYAFIRHPIYAAVLMFVWAAVLSHVSSGAAALGGLATIGVAMRIATEERLIVLRYPEYRAYAKRTKRLVPFVL